ncbi:MAG: family 78 glycoside hydrolase catalytic domain, partial [Candidatus Gallimonas sp.]
QGRSIYDFEQNMVGVAKIVIKAKRGSVLTVRFGEMLESDGSVYRRNLRRAEATDSYIASGCGTEVFRPLFTFHGFRYMELTAEGEIEIISIAGEVMYSQLSATAGFSCDDPVINRLYQNIVWGQRSNFLNVPTDCPQRDERLGWTGDSQVFCGTAMFNMDCRAFYKKHLADIRDAQCGNGGITGVAPVIPHPDHAVLQGRVGAAGWADVITILPYEYFRMYGDISVISENLWAMKRYNRYILDNSDHYIRRCYKEYGDWLSVGEETDKTLIATAFFAYSTLLIAEMCELIGDSDAAYYRELYGKIKRAFRKEFLVSPVLRSDTQTSYLLAYKAQIMTAAEIKDRLLRTINRNDRHLSTGFLGVKYLLPVLCELGETALAYELFTKRSYPSWCYSVVNGATTMWERWNAFTAENGFGDASMNSFNHYAYGSVGEWIFKYCLGFQPEATREGGGFKVLRVRPFVDFSGKINRVQGYYDSVRGRIDASWERKNEKVIYTISAPPEVELRFDFGNMKWRKTGEGIYELQE